MTTSANPSPLTSPAPVTAFPKNPAMPSGDASMVLGDDPSPAALPRYT